MTFSQLLTTLQLTIVLHQFSIIVAFTNSKLLSYGYCHHLDKNIPSSIALLSKCRNSHDIKERRNFLKEITKTITSSVVLTTNFIFVEPSYAGEVGARINKAVTESDLGLSVRRSVVRGAQIIDKVDGSWEKFSDKYSLGAERSKREGRPQPKTIPKNQPLDSKLALSILTKSDEAFLSTISSLVMLNKSDLDQKIEKIDGLVRKSFERAGLTFGDEKNEIITAEMFNYYSYLHFKAYCDILIERNVKFNRKELEFAIGEKILPLLVPNIDQMLRSNNMNDVTSTSNRLESPRVYLTRGLDIVDEICTSLQGHGFIALGERNKLDEDKIVDWNDGLSDLQLSIALDGDVTLNSQLLLQEQGLRVYPNFGRFVITYALKKSLEVIKQDVVCDEYYMDTDYNSDPDLFEVKEVLLNINIDSTL